MKRTKAQKTAFQVKQAVGSMAIEGVRLSRHSQAVMLKVASGRISITSVKDELIAQYRQSTPAV